MSALRLPLPVLLAVLVTGCHRPAPVPAATPAVPNSFYGTAFERRPSAAELADLGRILFSDKALSASGTLSCGSCHDPARAYGPADAGPIAFGGMDGRSPGLRAVPSLRYTHNIPSFSEHHFDEAVDESVDAGPTGGHDWDGRADSAHEQAQGPLLSPFEMANPSAEAVVRRLADGANAAGMKATFGAHVFDDSTIAFNGVLLALETFQQSPRDFYPFDSRYDAWLRGRKDALSAQELRGLTAFSDPRKGNCALCHPSQIRAGAFPQFTDFGLITLGVPRNAAIPANRDPAWFDLGLCGPLRTDLKSHPEYCGAFRAPSLRNVALRRSFFHNGVFHDLREAVAFYASRDTDPARWYPHGADGKPRIYDDLPVAYHANVNQEPPFGRMRGGKPALNAREIDDIVAFLKTLDDADMVPKAVAPGAAH